MLSDLINVMQAAVEEFKMHQKQLKTDLSAENRELIEVQGWIYTLNYYYILK